MRMVVCSQLVAFELTEEAARAICLGDLLLMKLPRENISEIIGDNDASWASAKSRLF